MDIRASTGKIESIKDYALQLSMVVMGILIALGVDGLRETWREHALVERSIESMRSELESNKALAQKVIAGYDELRKTVESVIALTEEILKQKAAKAPPAPDDRTIELGFAIPSFNTGAWQAAVATQALAHMEYSQASVWSTMYARQSQVQLVQNEWIGVLGRLSLLEASNEDSIEQLQQRLAFAKEVLQRINLTQMAWRNLLVQYAATLDTTAQK